MCPVCRENRYCQLHPNKSHRCPNPTCARDIRFDPAPGCFGSGWMPIIDLRLWAEDMVTHRACHGSGLIGHDDACHNRDRHLPDWTDFPPATVVDIAASAEAEVSLAEVINLASRAS